jgi:parvulin-like peptidyl-prolyl isomerase
MARCHGDFASTAQKETLLEEMVSFELVYAAALRAGYDKDPTVLERLKRLMVNKFRQDNLEPRLAKITVSETEIEDYYRHHQSDFRSPGRVRAAVIQISVPPRASEEKKTQLARRAEAARAEALKLNPATRSFGSVAVTYSDHQPTRYRGGDTGWLQPDRGDARWPAEVMAALLSLEEPGKVSPVITAPAGYYLVKLMERRESAPRPLEALKDRIRHRLLVQKKAAVAREFYEELKATVPVRVNRARLEAIEYSKGGTDKEEKQPPGLPGK